ncbi:MAG: energy transducer TonB, partial [Gammaproteobacteria bacterium]
MSKITMKVLPCLLLAGALLLPAAAPAQEAKALSMKELLELVKRGEVQDNKENREREARFRRDRANQQKLL